MPDFTTRDGCSIHYELDGFDDGGAAVVFLNGMTQSTAHWSSQARAFARDGYRVVSYDARGQGDSDLGEVDLSLELHAADLVALLDEVGLERAHLVGFSHGARIALQAAASHPERADRLVLCSATAASNALERTIVRAWREVLRLGGLEAMSWCALPTILGDDYLDDNEQILDRIVAAAVNRNDKDGVAALLDALIDYPDLSEFAPAVEAPTLVVTADEDLLVTDEGAETLADLTGGRHVTVEGVGHTIPIEAPHKFREIVEDFLTTERR